MCCPTLQDQVITRTVCYPILQDQVSPEPCVTSFSKTGYHKNRCCPILQEDLMIRNVQPPYLSDVMVGGCDDLVQGCGWDLYALPEGNGHHGALDLLHTGALEPQVQAIVGQGSHLHGVTVITDADDWDLC